MINTKTEHGKYTGNVAAVILSAKKISMLLAAAATEAAWDALLYADNKADRAFIYKAFKIDPKDAESVDFKGSNGNVMHLFDNDGGDVFMIQEPTEYQVRELLKDNNKEFHAMYVSNLNYIFGTTDNLNTKLESFKVRLTVRDIKAKENEPRMLLLQTTVIDYNEKIETSERVKAEFDLNGKEGVLDVKIVATGVSTVFKILKASTKEPVLGLPTTGCFELVKTTGVTGPVTTEEIGDGDYSFDTDELTVATGDKFTTVALSDQTDVLIESVSDYVKA